MTIMVARRRIRSAHSMTGARKGVMRCAIYIR